MNQLENKKNNSNEFKKVFPNQNIPAVKNQLEYYFGLVNFTLNKNMNNATIMRFNLYQNNWRKYLWIYQ